MDKFTQTKEGYWRTNEAFIFQLKTKIENVEEFGSMLFKYIRLKGLPFKTENIHLMYVDRRADPKTLDAYWNKGYLIMHVRKKSLISLLNPHHDELAGDETIVIEWNKGEGQFRSYQELKEDWGTRVTWKLPLEQIKEYKTLLEHFSQADDVYKLLLECVNENEKTEE